MWQQITGEAITGAAAKRQERLKPLFLIIMKWNEAKATYPHAQVLSQTTGYFRNYNANPYGDYDSKQETIYPTNQADDHRLPPKAEVYGITVDGMAMAFPFDQLNEVSETTVILGKVKVRIQKEQANIQFSRLDTKEAVISTRVFWFTWVAFHPDTQIFSP